MRTRAEAFAGRQTELETTRGAALKELDEQRAELGDKRATIAAELPDALVTQYQRLRRQALHGLPDGARAVRPEPDQGGRAGRRTAL